MMSADMLALWWAWVAFGLILAILEVVVPGFIFLGFAIGAVLVGLVLLVAGLPALWALLLFAILSLLAVVGLRRGFGHRGRDTRIIRHDINDNPPPQP